MEEGRQRLEEDYSILMVNILSLAARTLTTLKCKGKLLLKE
jgi:hypothetical protein